MGLCRVPTPTPALFPGYAPSLFFFRVPPARRHITRRALLRPPNGMSRRTGVYVLKLPPYVFSFSKPLLLLRLFRQTGQAT